MGFFWNGQGFLDGRLASMQSSLSLVMCTLVLVSTSNKSMDIPVQLITLSHTLKVVDSSVLVDSGADISYID